MSPTLIAAFAVLSAVSLESRPMKVEAYCVPTETIRLGDPVFLKIVIENTGVQPVRTYSHFSRAFGTLRLEVESPFYDYIYLARTDSGGGEAGRIPLPPGTGRVVAYEIVEMPRPRDFKHDFWDFVSTNPDPSFLTATLHDRQGNERWIAQALSLRIQPRPQEEMEALQSVFSEAEHRRQPELRRLIVRPKDFDDMRPTPACFGLDSFSPDDELIEELLKLEDKISPGTLRDIVFLTKTMRQIYDSKQDFRRRQVIAELSSWLDSLPLIERECLAMKVFSWCSHFGPSEDPFFELASVALQRAPERYGGRDYRTYLRTQFSENRPEFEEFLQRGKGGQFLPHQE